MKDVEYLKKYLEPSKLDEGLKLIEKGIPVQYIVGNVDFYGYNFIVNKNVLIPRFETEGLIEKTINYINKYFNKKVDIIDLGTGSGCIAVVLKNEVNCNMDACDISDKALDVALMNAKMNNCYINFFKNNFLENIDEKYDVIISNPPYISYDEEIMDIVKDNEPSIALYADNNGLKCYYDILKHIKHNLKDKAIIAFEIGRTQGNAIKSLMEEKLKNIEVIIEKDLSENDRYVFGFYNIKI